MITEFKIYCDKCKKEIDQKGLVIVLIYDYPVMDLCHGSCRYHFCGKKCLRAWLNEGKGKR